MPKRANKKPGGFRLTVHPHVRSPLRNIQTWRVNRNVVLALNPLSRDRLQVRKGGAVLLKRGTNKLVVLLSADKEACVVYPSPFGVGVPYQLDVQYGEIEAVEGYWLSAILDQQAKQGILSVELVHRFDDSDDLVREIELASSFYRLPTSTESDDDTERETYAKVWEESCSSATSAMSSLERGVEDEPQRYDLRENEIFTIDGATTKDIDDAIEVVKIDDERSIIGIHIADVTEYVAEGSRRDIDARSRGTSHYLADRVLHMLPEILSQEYCSLRPDEDR